MLGPESVITELYINPEVLEDVVSWREGKPISLREYIGARAPLAADAFEIPFAEDRIIKRVGELTSDEACLVVMERLNHLSEDFGLTTPTRGFVSRDELIDGVRSDGTGYFYSMIELTDILLLEDLAERGRLFPGEASDPLNPPQPLF